MFLILRQNGVGGAIDVLGDRVGLLNANINASGTAGGGSLRIGGDFQGTGPVANAERTYIDATSTITANALENGNGGRVIVWADEATQFLGNISARGGELSGDGGFAEVSGKATLSFDGIVDLAAEVGSQGELLLDPENVIIDDTGSDDSRFIRSILASDSPSDTFSISSSKIATALVNGDVDIAATDRITVSSPITATSTSNSLTFEAGTIDIKESIEIGGDLVLVSASGDVNFEEL